MSDSEHDTPTEEYIPVQPRNREPEPSPPSPKRMVTINETPLIVRLCEWTNDARARMAKDFMASWPEFAMDYCRAYAKIGRGKCTITGASLPEPITTADEYGRVWAPDIVSMCMHPQVAEFMDNWSNETGVRVIYDMSGETEALILKWIFTLTPEPETESDGSIGNSVTTSSSEEPSNSSTEEYSSSEEEYESEEEVTRMC